MQGFFHQEKRKLLSGETAGIRCACNSLYALRCVQMKNIFQCGKSDLNHISVEGDS